VPVVPPGTRDLATGNPDRQLLPALFDVVEAAAAAAADADRHLPLYGEPATVPSLEDWGRSWLADDGIEAAAVTVTSGAMDAVERALQAHLRPGMRVAVEDPSYAGLLDLLVAMGLVAEPVAVDDEGMMPDALATSLEHGVQAVVVTPRAQNPTGAALTESRAVALASVLAGSEDVLVIEDDHAAPIADMPAWSLRPTGNGRRITVRSFSKAFGPDLRTAIVGGDEATVGAIEARRSVGAGWVSQILQWVILEFVASKDTEPYLDGIVSEYARRRQALIGELAARGVEARGTSGLNVWVPVAEEGPVVAGMAARGWAISAGARYRIASPPGVRVTTATLLPEEAATVANDLVACIAGVDPTRSG
jgi:DNA-binding transcriptional MocR family regulator